jgi:hypothetical protein
VREQEFGVAVKRLKAIGQFEHQLRGAAKQIQRSQRPGFVVADLTLALDPENRKYVDSTNATMLSRAAYQRVERLVTEYFPRMRSWVLGRGVRGCVFTDYRVALVAPQNWSMLGFHLNVSFARDRRERRDTESFFTRFRNGLKSDDWSVVRGDVPSDTAQALEVPDLHRLGVL